MPHDVSLISTIAAGFGLALILGFAASWLRMPPLIGYLVGGAFLSLAYFDLPYDVMVAIVLARKWVESRAWEREPVYRAGWKTVPGLARMSWMMPGPISSSAGASTRASDSTISALPSKR